MTNATRPSRARILVVEDDLAIGRSIRRYLDRYALQVAETVEAGLALLATFEFDLVLLDYRLPDGNGEQILDAIRLKSGPLPVIVMSGDAARRRVPTPHGNDADDFIEKPFVAEALQGKVERMLAEFELRAATVAHRQEVDDLNARREVEVEVARTLLDRMVSRGEFEAGKVRHVVIAADNLAGDVVLGARTATGAYRWMLGDVTGHTLSSALVTIPVASTFYAHARTASFEDVLARLEAELAALLPANMFCVGAMCELDRTRGTVRIWNGGNPDVLIRRVLGEVTTVASTGVPLGADRFGTPEHRSVELAVAAGDRIYVFSDGLTEMRDRRDEMIGFARILEIVRTGTAETVFGRMLACMPYYPHAAAYSDDVSLIEVIV